jgi:hypothetical protein
MAPLSKPPVVSDLPKHVIAEYKHKTQTVICVCGWTGSSASIDTRPSEWSGHVASTRPKRT